MAALGPGTTLSHYRIVETLGQGGQATAFKAEDLRLSRPVVIKALKPELTASEAARRRFEREAALCSALDNPHIQAVYDVGQSDGLYYIVLQYVEGPTLKQFMAGRPLETLSVLSIAIQVADALAVAHASGIVHRDLKPSNIIVGPGGQARVLDFGLAKMLAPAPAEKGSTPPPGDDPLTEVGVPYGSAGYGSPEQARGETADQRTDVFSLGVVLYEMAAGVPPFRGEHAVEVLNAVINTPARRLLDANPRALPALQPILDRAMAKSPRDRYQTMAAFRDDMKALMRRLTRETGVVPTETTATLVAPSRARTGWPFSGTLGRVLSRIRPAGAAAALARSEPAAAAAPSRPPHWGSESRPTLAVLPFRNLAGTPDAAFYEFALADGVITQLAHVQSIVVRPSAYIAPYVGQTPDPRQVGAELQTSLVLSCGFIRTPERMRVTAQLLDATSGDMLWSDRIDVQARDLIDVQDEIASRLLAGLELRLTEEEQKRIERPLTHSAEAYDFYLRARDALFRYLLRTHNEADLDEAVKMLHEAIGLDNDFARAHATLGRCYVLYAQGWGGAETFLLAERSLRRALSIEPSLASARLQMVYVDLHHGDKDKARARVLELLAERPEDPSALFVAGMIHRLDGLYDKALATYDRLLEVNPRDVVIVAFNKARVFTHAGRFEEAVAEIDRGRAAEPEHPLLKTFLAVALFNQGMIDDCQALLDDVLRQNPHFDGVLPLVAWCLSARGRHDEARAVVTQRVRDIAAADHDIALWLAELYSMEGLVEDALEWLRRAVQIGNENYPLFATSPKLDPLRRDPRFVELLEELRRRFDARRQAEPASAS